MALGCIQSRSCNNDMCPTGIATQNESRNNGLVVEDKAERVRRFHHETVTNLLELVAAAGLDSLEQLEPRHINHRVQGTNVKTYAQLYPTIDSKCLLDDTGIPEDWRVDWRQASASHW